MRDKTATVSEAQQADDLVRAATFVVLGLVLVTGVVFIVWQWRTAKNAQECLERTGARFGPGWSIGAWFIPFANLVIPVLIMQGLWRSSDPESSPHSWRNRPGSALIGWWWAAFVVAGLASRRTGTTTSSTLSELRSVDNWAAFAALTSAVAAVLAMFVVRRMTARQAALRASSTRTESACDLSSLGAGVRCASCGAEYIDGTVLCADCMGTDLRPIVAP